ncbi:hypothetical protein RhiirC2_798756 [Rhizophagus irregularis]|uniref:Uncharacterized protein n=1 Tax=Rhizophagus irregularis TaxID=588596 RepID=A0A2N1M5Z4_9GLOM|nr:hypothetical protein RhiirC2_798756 [Rhizophagus irregularis]
MCSKHCNDDLKTYILEHAAVNALKNMNGIDYNNVPIRNNNNNEESEKEITVDDNNNNDIYSDDDEQALDLTDILI